MKVKYINIIWNNKIIIWFSIFTMFFFTWCGITCDIFFYILL